MKFEPGPPMTLGNAAKAEVRLIIWCHGCGSGASVRAPSVFLPGDGSRDRGVQPLGPLSRPRYARAICRSSDVSEISWCSRSRRIGPLRTSRPDWNVAPTNPLPVVRYDATASERALDVMRWGLVPFWAKDIEVGFSNINAKAEGIESKPAFREAFRRRRCLVPVDNFYEWKKTATGKQPQ
jgi:hypothetical protein